MNHSAPHTAPPFAPALPALFLATAVFFDNFLARSIFGPLLLPISVQVRQSLAQSAQIFVFLSAGYSLSVLCAGFLSRYAGHKNTIIVSLAAIGTALFGMAGSQSLWQFCAWIFLMGAGAGLYLPSGVVTITEITPSAHWSQAFAVHELAPNLAFCMAPLLAEVCLRSGGLPVLLRIVGGISLGLALLYALRGPRIRRPGVAPALGNVMDIARRGAFWRVTVLFVLAVGAEIGVYNLIPALLVEEKGLDQRTANLLLGASRLLPIIFLPFMGRVIRRAGYRKVMTICLAGMGIATLCCGYGPLWWSVAMLAVQPVFVVCFFPPGFAALSLVCPKTANDLGVSLTIMCTSLIGAGAMPALLAWVGENHSFPLAFACFGVLILAGGVWALSRLRIPK